ncbi:MAG: septum formation initiator family protein [Clostridia bacterium]|nr:septum formation initiator family protein [Clostridia bacterium]
MKKKSKRIDMGYDQIIDFDLAREERRKKRKEILQKKTPAETDGFSKRRMAKRRRYALIITALVLFVVALVASSGLKLWRLAREKQATQAELSNLLEKEAELQNELTQLESKEYIEREARAELHMIFPGEVLYVIPLDKTAEEEALEESDAKPQ